MGTNGHESEKLAGVGPSSGAAGQGDDGVCEKSGTIRRKNAAALEDGRAPAPSPEALAFPDRSARVFSSSDCSSFVSIRGFEKGSVDWLVWQIADSAFPTGGFAHSNGLEAAWQQGEIGSPEELAEYVQVQLTQIGRAALPFVNEAYHGDRTFGEVDRLCDAFLSNHVANRGSRSQGKAFLLAATQTFAMPPLARFRASVLAEKLPGHLGPIFGAVLRSLEVSHAICLRLFLFINIRGLVASAVRLGMIGPMAAQSLQARVTSHAEQVALRSATLHMEEATQISPLLDILHGAHDRLYSRLFQT